MTTRRFWLAAGMAIGVAMSLRIRRHVRVTAGRVRAAIRRAGPDRLARRVERLRELLRAGFQVGHREMVEREAELRAEFDPPGRVLG